MVLNIAEQDSAVSPDGQPAGQPEAGGEAVDRPRRQLERPTGRAGLLHRGLQSLQVVRDPVALRPELFRRNAGTHRTSRTALGSRRCDRLSRGRSRRFALLPTAAQKQHRREDEGQSFYFHVRMFSFSAGASYAYHTINRSRCTAKRAVARKMRQRLFSAFQFSRVSAQDWQAVMRLIL